MFFAPGGPYPTLLKGKEWLTAVKCKQKIRRKNITMWTFAPIVQVFHTMFSVTWGTESYTDMGTINHQKHWNHIFVQMPKSCEKGPTCNTAAWWASYLLTLGQQAKYDLLIEYLTIAQVNGCLNVIRQAADAEVRAQVNVLKGIKKRRAGVFIRVAA